MTVDAGNGGKRLSVLNVARVAAAGFVTVGFLYIDAALFGAVSLVDLVDSGFVLAVAILWLLAVGFAVAGLAARREGKVASIVVMGLLIADLIPAAVVAIGLAIFLGIHPT